jgi:hypothetical protein
MMTSAKRNGNVCVADTFNHRIQKFDASGTFLTTWGSNGSSNGQFSTFATSVRRSTAVRRDTAGGARRGRLISGGSVNQGVCGSYLPASRSNVQMVNAQPLPPLNAEAPARRTVSGAFARV